MISRVIFTSHELFILRSCLDYLTEAEVCVYVSISVCFFGFVLVCVCARARAYRSLHENGDGSWRGIESAQERER